MIFEGIVKHNRTDISAHDEWGNLISADIKLCWH